MKIKKDRFFFSVSILCLVFVGLLFANYIKHTKSMYNSSLDEVHDIVVNVKEDSMKEVIDDIINGIEIVKAEKEVQCEKLISYIERITESGIGYEDLFNIYKNLKNNNTTKNPLLMASGIVVDRLNNKVIFSTIEDIPEGQTIEGVKIDEYKKNFKYSAVHTFKELDIDILVGIKEEDIDEAVKYQVLGEIRQKRTPTGGYVWVDEILDFNGGDDYARRVVHPNIVEGEEKMLSTNYKDSTGENIYKQMLDGINKDGEILISYYFEKDGSDKESKKLSYLKLYPKYNWVIGTGLYIDELDTYIGEKRTEFEKDLKSQILSVVGITGLLFIIVGIMGWGLFNYFEYKKRQLSKQETEIIKSHYKLMESKYDKSNSLIHDIKNHLISIHGLAVKDNAEDISKYVKSIQCDISQLGYMVVTDNKILDIILSEKMYIMRNHNIDFNHSIENVNLDFIEYKDLVSIFTNLLDNAIESCIDSIHKEIRFSLYTFNDNFVVIKLINSCDNKPKLKDGELQTNKKNKQYHGYGVTNINNIVNKYSGNLKWNYSDVENEFSVVIMLPRKQ